MIQQVTLIVILLQLAKLTEIQAAKQNLKLSDSYLPVAMQVIAHLTDQMAFEAKDEPAKPVKPTTTTFKPTSRPIVSMTTPLHKPGLFAPASPPKASDRISPKSEHRFVLLPLEYNSEYTVIEPEEKRTEEPLLSIQEEEIKPLMEPNPESAPLLPPHFESEIKSRSEFDDENLQYLSENVRDIIKMANDPDDERLIDLSELKAGPQKGPGNKLSSSNLRLLLLYDLLSREAKRQKLSDYVGFSPSVMQSLVASSSGGARAQLSMALSKMVDRNDCGHEYANNRAKEMVTELAKDESKLSSELRYLQPLVYIN
ncbi:ecdysone-inducible gene E3 [Aphomia sociella]